MKTEQKLRTYIETQMKIELEFEKNHDNLNKKKVIENLMKIQVLCFLLIFSIFYVSLCIFDECLIVFNDFFHIFGQFSHTFLQFFQIFDQFSAFFTIFVEVLPNF